MITPKEAEGFHSEHERQLIAAAEKYIDEQLRAYDGSSPICIGSIANLPTTQLGSKVRTAIEAMYRKAGWNVEYNYERTGDFWRFSVKTA